MKKHAALMAGVLTGFTVSLWSVLKVRGKKIKKSVPYRVPEFANKPRIHEKVAWTLLGTLALMWIVNGTGLDRYYQTSILSLTEKNSVVREANKLLGRGYRLGSTGPDYFDCSGYTRAVLEEALGLKNLPRSSSDIYAAVGRPIGKNDLGVGDLVFFDTFSRGYVTHVGIVVDTEGHFANANSYYGDTRIDDLNAEYWRNTWIGARELTEKDGIEPGTREEVVLASEEELTESVYDTVGFPPSEFADPRLNPDNFAATTATDPVAAVEESVVVAEAPIEVPVEPEVARADAAAETPSEEPKEAPKKIRLFTDIPVDSQYYEATAYLKKFGIAEGYADGTFQSGRTISRVEVVKMAFNAFDIAPLNDGPEFTDVPDAHWGNAYVRTAAKRGIVAGYPDGVFRPDQIVSRIEALKILFKTGDLPTESYEDGLFTDVSAGDWFAPYVAAAAERKLFDVSGSAFTPTRGMTRGEVAMFLYRLMNS